MGSRKLSLFTFIDAFGWRLLNEHAFLEDVLVTRSPVETVLGYSSTCVPTILTGRAPRDHGHFAFFRYDPAESPFGALRWLSALPDAVMSRGRVRRWVSKAVQRWHGYTGYFQLYNVPFSRLPLLDYSEKRDLYERDGVNGGVPTIFDRLRDEAIPFHVSDWRRPEAERIPHLLRSLEEEKPAFAYLYLADLDGVLHRVGREGAEVGEKIAWLDGRLREVLDRASDLYDEVRLHVLSDHGMADVVETRDVVSRIDSLGLRWGEDYAAVFDSTMARFWFLEDGAEPRIREALAAESRGRVLSKTELAALGCDFDGDAFGEMIFLMDPGVIICPSDMGATPLAGMHGYSPDHEDSTAMFAANVAVAEPPRRLQDHHAFMLAEARRCAEREPALVG